MQTDSSGVKESLFFRNHCFLEETKKTDDGINSLLKEFKFVKTPSNL
jgi:hypothetical protein